VPLICCRERNIPEIQSMYEISFPKLSERYFKIGPWPQVDLVSDLVDQDHVFCLLYKVGLVGGAPPAAAGGFTVGAVQCCRQAGVLSCELRPLTLLFHPTPPTAGALLPPPLRQDAAGPARALRELVRL
jgi:hypothetical protein